MKELAAANKELVIEGMLFDGKQRTALPLKMLYVAKGETRGFATKEHQERGFGKDGGGTCT